MTTNQITTNPTNKCVFNINNLLVSEFKEHNITIYGTWENPLFKAKDIGDMLGIAKVRKTIDSFDDTQKILLLARSGKDETGAYGAPAPGGGGNREQYFLTEDGLYELLYVSRKEAAKEFRKHVSTLLKQQRLGYAENIKIQYEERMIKFQRSMTSTLPLTWPRCSFAE